MTASERRQRRTRVLMSAFACAPGQGSEPGNGWNWATQAANHHDVWVLAANYDLLEDPYFRDHPERSFRLVYVSVPGWPGRLVKPANAIRIYYILWQFAALPVAWRLHRREKFDIVHHVTFNSIEMPGFLWLLKPPFVWGPVGGAQVPPRALRHYFGRRWSSELVRALRKHVVKINPSVRLALRKASLVLAANEDTERLLRACGARRVERELDVGVDMDFSAPVRNSKDDRTLTIVWVGRLIPRKGPLLAISVIEELHRRNAPVRLLMAGDGVQRDLVLQRIKDAGLQDHVNMLGQVPHSTIADCYAQADAFFFSSLHDTSGTVILEAMKQGLPVVALNHQGAAEIIDDGTGIKVPIHSEEQVVHDLAGAFEQLANDRGLAREMGERARQHVMERYVWERKSSVLRDWYSDVSGIA